MVNSAKGRLFKVVQNGYNKYLIYLPHDLTVDSAWPCKLEPEEGLEVSVRIEDGKLVVEDVEKNEQE